jgi:hypothetical protein
MDSHSPKSRSVSLSPVSPSSSSASLTLVTEKYQPLLEEIARIQAQAGLDAEEMSKGGRAGLGTGGVGADSRNRR